MDSARGRRSLRKPLAISAAVLLAAILSFAIWARLEIDSQWADLARRVDALDKASRSGTYRPPDFLGTSIPGNAWDDYEAAAREATSIFGKSGAARRALLDLISEERRVLRCEEAQEEYRIHADVRAAALRLLLRGAGRNGMSVEIADEPFDDAGAHYGALNTLSLLASVEARRLGAAGEVDPALDLLWAQARMGLDVAHTGAMLRTMWGGAFVRRSLDEFFLLLRDGRLDAQRLASLEGDLALLEETWPLHGPALRREAVLWGKYFLGGGPLGRDASKVIHPTWSQLYSVRLMKAQAFFSIEDWASRVAERESRPYADHQALNAAIELEAKGTRNPLIQEVVGLFHPSRARLEWVARMRVLRSLIRYRREGRVSEFEDPLGSRLRYSLEDRRIRVWSVGGDGVDNGGNVRRQEDIVLEMPR